MKPLSAVSLLLPSLLLPSLLLTGCGKKSETPVAADRPAIDRWAGQAERPLPHDTATSKRQDRDGGRTRPSSDGTVDSTRLPKGAVVQVRVVGVTDGDTVKILTREKSEIRMRLNGIDAPESKMPYGQQAKEHLSDLVYDKDVTAKIDGYDRYGRALGALTIGGDSVNARMVRDGYAWWYEAYAKKDRELESLEQSARSAKRGLWSQSRPQKPWEWRKNKREGATSSKGAPDEFEL